MTKLLLASMWCLRVLAQAARSILRRAIADFQSLQLFQGFTKLVVPDQSRHS